MELREFINLFRAQSRLFLGIVGFFVLIAVLLKLFVPSGRVAIAEISVTRSGTQQTEQYTYDDFYRLQADEKFAETVTRWLGIPKVTQQILADANFSEQDVLKLLTRRYFQANRLSAQLVLVRFPAKSLAEAKRVVGSIEKVIQGKTEELNREQKNDHWFVVSAAEPVLESTAFSWTRVLAIGLGSGLFVALWAVLLNHYYRTEFKRG